MIPQCSKTFHDLQLGLLRVSGLCPTQRHSCRRGCSPTCTLLAKPCPLSEGCAHPQEGVPFSNSQKGRISCGLRHRIKITTPWPRQGVHDLDQSMFPTSLPTLTSDNSIASKLLAFPHAVCSTRRPLLSGIFQRSAQVPTPPCTLSRHKVGIHCTFLYVPRAFCWGRFYGSVRAQIKCLFVSLLN